MINKPIQKQNRDNVLLEYKDLVMPSHIRELREIRLALLAQECTEKGGIDSVAPRMRARLEREPLLRPLENEQRAKYAGEDICLMFLFHHEHENLEDIQDKNQLDFRIRFSLRFAYQYAKAPLSAYSVFVTNYLSNVVSYLDWQCVFYSHNKVSDKANNIRSSIENAVAASLVIGGVEHKSKEDLDIMAKLIGEVFFDIAGLFREPAQTFRYNSDLSLNIILFDKSFSSFTDPLFDLDSLTQWIESRPFVDRGIYQVGDFDSINSLTWRELFYFGYDYTRVREFALINKNGEELEVVSKRLNPMKSRHAENEIFNSKLLHDVGVPTPMPIAIIQAEGNTYFLWEKIQQDITVQDRFPNEVLQQVQAIQKQLEELGIEHHDLAERNFLYTLDKSGNPKVWLVDFERTYIPDVTSNLEFS